MSDVTVTVVESSTDVSVSEQDVAVSVTEQTVDVSASSAGLQGASYEKGDPIYVVVRNQTGSTLAKGTIVYTSGANGTHTLVSPALASSDSTSARTLGWLAEELANNASGLCQVEGYLDGIDTQGIAEGSQLYLSGTVAGGFQTAKPVAPIHLVYVGVTAKASAGNGRVYIKCQNGYELDEIHDVLISSKANGDLLRYDSATGLWKNAALSGVTVGSATNAGTAGSLSGSITPSQVSGTAIIASDSRLSDARYPTAHGDTHSAGGGDPVQVSQAQVTGLSSALSARALLNGGNSFSGGQVISTGGTAVKGLIVQGVSSQSANLQEWQTSTGGTVTRITASGSLLFPNSGSSINGDSGNATFISNSTAIVPLQVTGASNQTANLQNWSVGTGNAIAAITSQGAIIAYGPNLFQSFVTTRVPLTIKAAASQSANLLEIQNSSGGTGTWVTSGFGLYSQGLFTGRYIQDYNATTPYLDFNSNRLTVNARSSAYVALTVQGASGQSANLQDWQNNTGGTVAWVDSTGIFRATQVRTTSSFNVLSETVGGGGITMYRGTATPTNPGANFGRLYFRDGTNAGTLKLVVRAGTAGAETTIFDNIPT